MRPSPFPEKHFIVQDNIHTVRFRQALAHALSGDPVSIESGEEYAMAWLNLTSYERLLFNLKIHWAQYGSCPLDVRLP